MQKIINEKEKKVSIYEDKTQKKFFIECFPETKTIIDQVHAIRGGTRKDFIHKMYLIELDTLMRTEAVEKRSTIGELRLDGLVEQFLRLATLDIDRYKRWTYMPFARWFVGLPEEQKDMVLEKTIDTYIDNWCNLLFINTSISGNPYKKLVQYLEDRSVLDDIEAHTLILKERNVFKKQEKMFKEWLGFNWFRTFRHDNKGLYDNDNEKYKEFLDIKLKKKRKEYEAELGNNKEVLLK